MIHIFSLARLAMNQFFDWLSRVLLASPEAAIAKACDPAFALGLSSKNSLAAR